MKFYRRFLAFGFFCYCVGVVVTTKGFEPRLEFEVLSWLGKVWTIFVIGVLMWIGFVAGRESKE